MGAYAHARRINSELQSRVGAAETFDRVLATVNKDLDSARALHRGALQELSKLQLEVEEIPELRRRCDEACSELAQARSKHAEELDAARREFNESRGRLIKEASEEQARLRRRLEESEDRVRKQKDIISSRDERTRWDQATISKLREELSQSEVETRDARLKIKGLKETVDRVKADKLRAFDQVTGLTEAVTRLEAEAERARLESQRQKTALQEELASSQQKSSEFERRTIESEARATKAEYELALLRGAQDVDCRKAFRLGTQEARAAVSQKFPVLDLSFLEEFNAPTPVAEASEESEYEDISDAEAEDQNVERLPTEIRTSEARTFEVGGSSRGPSASAADSPEAGPAP